MGVRYLNAGVSFSLPLDVEADEEVAAGMGGTGGMVCLDLGKAVVCRAV